MLGGIVFVLLNVRRWHASYHECVNYEDFDSVKADFDRIAELAYEHGDGNYSLGNTDVFVSDADVERIDKIISYSRSNTGNKRSLSNIRVKNGSVSFEYDAIGCGIVKTTDIKRFIKDHDTYGGMDYKKLADHWYSYFY